MESFKDKKILIVGGTGTIGKTLVKQTLKEGPKVIRILSRDEHKQFELERYNEFEDYSKIRFLIGDVRDYDRLERAMNNIDVVFNLAAMKHVPSCEYNPDEAIKTNIIGMQNVIRAAIKNNVECVLFTSSDKAINPTNTYGATKMLAEKLVQAANHSKGNAKTKFVAVRFGNVMGSRGSVIPLFRKQIFDNREITVTDPNMTRFMMTSEQAIKLLMDVCKISKGGEVFILKMPVIKLRDLAEIVIEEVKNKYKINEDINIREIGLRPGERMYEELMTEDESYKGLDLGNMYVLSNKECSLKDYSKYFSNIKKCEIQEYSSHKAEVISKELVRKFLLDENII